MDAIFFMEWTSCSETANIALGVFQLGGKSILEPYIIRIQCC